VSKVLIVTADVVGERMAGPGIRAWEFAQLLSHRHSVVLAAKAPLPSSGVFRLVESQPASIDPIARDFDVAIAQGYALEDIPSIARAKHLVIDLYDPFVLENLEVHEGQPLMERESIHEMDLMALRRQLLQGDFFLCASERQRHFWLGMLTIVNRVNPSTYAADRSMRRLLDVVPFGLSTEPLRKTGVGLRDGGAIGAGDVVVLWAGGIWNWFDPLTLIRGMELAVRQCPQLKLVFMGTRHPNPSIPEMQMLNAAYALSDQVRLTGRHVFFREGWVPYNDRKNILADADIGVSLHFEHVESIYSFRTRVLDYLWAGLPMLLTRGDEMSELATAEQLGLVVDYQDVRGVADALVKLGTDKALRAAYAARVHRVAPRFAWPAATQALQAFCDAPWLAPDHVRRRQDLRRIGRRWLPARVLMRKAWRALRKEGASSVVRRTFRYARKHL
jgi:glycosyltransferase involved in cell wall biosynthesis